MLPQSTTRTWNQLLKPERVAEELGVSVEQVWFWMDSGHIPYFRIGQQRRMWRIPDTIRDDYPDFLAALEEADVKRLEQEAAAAVPRPAPVPVSSVLVMNESANKWPEVPLPVKLRSAVYVLHMEPFYKIGYSLRPAQRVAELAGSLPVRPRLIALLESEAADSLEDALHIKFAPLRANGEWFLLSDEHVQYLQALSERMAKHRLRRIVANNRSGSAWAWSRIPNTQFDSLIVACDFLVQHTCYHR